MKAIAVVFSMVLSVLLCAATCFAAAGGASSKSGETIHGAGATFPAPLYNHWIAEYKKVKPGLKIVYDAVGSGDGIKLFMADKVDFGASDAAMTDKQMQDSPHGAVLIPATAGLIVLAYNLPGINGRLRLSRQAYVDILLGKISKWNDPAIAGDNPDLSLPDRAITTVVRSDSSGTTFAITNHLSTISPEWKNGPGVGKKIQWPGTIMLGRGNSGVARKIQISRGSIGYVEYGFAKRAGLGMAVLENSTGGFVAPSPESGEATLKNMSAELPENLRLFMPNPEGKTSYPMITFSWLLLKKKYAESKIKDNVLDFVKWGVTRGQKYALDFGYTQLPKEITEKDLKALATIN